MISKERSIKMNMPMIIIIELLTTVLAGYVNPKIGISVGIISIVYIVVITIIGQILKNKAKDYENR